MVKGASGSAGEEEALEESGQSLYGESLSKGIRQLFTSERQYSTRFQTLVSNSSNLGKIYLGV